MNINNLGLELTWTGNATAHMRQLKENEPPPAYGVPLHRRGINPTLPPFPSVGGVAGEA